jgi:hypothetical protein
VLSVVTVLWLPRQEQPLEYWDEKNAQDDVDEPLFLNKPVSELSSIGSVVVLSEAR